MRKRIWAQAAISVVPLAALLTFYCLWLFSATPEYIESVISGSVLFALAAILYIRFVPRLISFFMPDETALSSDGAVGMRSGRRSSAREILVLLAAVVAFRVAILLICYWMYYAENGYTCTFFSAQRMYGAQGDARHYMAIAEHGYVSDTTDGANLTLVFLPLYSYLTRLFAIVSQNYVRSGFFVNNIAAIVSCLVLYALVKDEYDRKTARRAVRYFCILPAACLLYANMSDSLFFLLSVTSFYFMRKKRIPLAALAAGLAAYTRLIGVVLFVPLVMEYVHNLLAERKKPSLELKGFAIKQTLYGVSLLLVPLAIGVYLYQNYLVSGNWFQFLIYQNENWHQSFSMFFRTAGYQTDYFISNLVSSNFRSAFATWFPNLIAIFSALAVLLLSQKRMRASYVAYFIAYFFTAVGVSWLLSGPRYLLCCFPLVLGFALITEKKYVDIPLTIVSFAAFLLYMYGVVAGYPIY